MDYVQGGLGWKVWGAALVLAWRLIGVQDIIRGKRVLELGSGCGLCGLLVAKLGASEVILSDCVPEILANLQTNVSLLWTCNQKTCFYANEEETHSELKPNEQEGAITWQTNDELIVKDACCNPSHGCIALQNSTGVMARVYFLNWLEDSTESSHASSTKNTEDAGPFNVLNEDEKFDWVIGSDLMYDLTCLSALAGVIHHRLLNGTGRGLFVCPVRERAGLDFFLKQLVDLGMSVKVDHVDEQEWNTCRSTLSETDLHGYNESTFHDIDHYEGGMVVISVRDKSG